MTFFRRISNSVPIVANQESQTEVTPPAPQPQTNFGIAERIDLFETVARTEVDRLGLSDQAEDLLRNKENKSLLLDRLSSISGKQDDPQSQIAVEIGSPATQNNMIVDASNLFSYLDPNAIRFNEHMAQLSDRLNAINDRRKEIRSQLNENKTKVLELQKAASDIRGALADDKAVHNSVLATLGPLGILGMIGGLPALPVIGGILGGTGLSEEYKSRMEKAAAELEKRAGELEINSQPLMEELEEMEKEAESTREQIDRENQRQEERLAPAKVFVGSNSMEAEQSFQVFENDEITIQNDKDSSVSTFNASDVTKDKP